MSKVDDLLEELEYNAKASGNKMLERRMADVAIWYYQNRSRVPPENLAARQALLEKALWTLLEVNALLTERLHELEAMKKGRSRLWMPRGMKVNGDANFS